MVNEPATSTASVAVPPHEPVSSAERRAASGDRDALTVLLRQHGKSILQLCQHLNGPRDGRDAAQEAFERIVTGIGRFDPDRGTFKTWALAVARNLCRDRLRRRGLERATFLADGETQTELATSRDPGPERRVAARADADALQRALATLPENMSSALVLFHLHEASYEEIADILGVPMGTVMTWLHRGRKRLRAAMEAQ